MKKGTKVFWDVLLAGLGSAIETAKDGIKDIAEDEQTYLLADGDKDDEDVVPGEGT